MASTIKVLQHMYTSSHRSGGGFHTIAYSNGLTPDEIYTLENLAIYPIDIGLRCGRDEQPPEIYRYIKLNEKHFACSKSVFIPKDFAGRPGNYFSHSLVINVNEINNPFVIFTLPDIFESHYDKETSVLPPKEIELKENEEINYQYPSSEILNQIPLILEAVVRTFKDSSSVFIVIEQEADIFLILSTVFFTLPPWLRKEMTFTTFTLNPVRESVNYRIMFSLSKYNPRIPSDNPNIITFDFANKNIPKIEITSTWVKVISSYLKNNEMEKIAELVNFHKQYGKENPIEMAEILAELTIAEKEFYQKEDVSCLSYLNTIISIKNSAIKIELLQNRIESLIKKLLERNSYDDYIVLLHLLNKQPEVDIRKIFERAIEMLITTSNLSLILTDIHEGANFIVNLIPFTPINERTKIFVFGTLSHLIEKNPANNAQAFKSALHSLLVEFGPNIVSIIEDLFIYLVKKFKERVDIASYILEIFTGSEILTHKLNTMLDILSSDFNVEVYVGWISALIKFLSDEKKKIAVIERSLCQCIDKGIEEISPTSLNKLLSPFSWKACRTIKKNIENFYDKGRKLRKPSAKSFLFFGKRSSGEQTKEEIVYNKLVKTLQEFVMIKKSQKNV